MGLLGSLVARLPSRPLGAVFIGPSRPAPLLAAAAATKPTATINPPPAPLQQARVAGAAAAAGSGRRVIFMLWPRRKRDTCS